MGADNIAVCFAPTLFRADDQRTLSVVTYFIEQYDTIFLGSEYVGASTSDTHESQPTKSLPPVPAVVVSSTDDVPMIPPSKPLPIPGLKQSAPNN